MMNAWLRRCVVVAAAAAALAALAGLPLHPPGGAAGLGPDRDVVVVAWWSAWLVIGYLLLSVIAVAMSALPGALGAAAARLSRLAPAGLRRVVELAIGAGVAAAAVAPAAPALADSPRPHPPAAVSLDWAAVTPPAPAAALPTAPAATATSHVVVEPGDSLWSIAADALGPSATPAQVAAAWPRWWAANRAVVGAHPDLIHPGQRLTPPDPSPSTVRSGRSPR